MTVYEADIRGIIRESLLSVWDGTTVDALLDAYSGLVQEFEDLHYEIQTAFDVEVATGIFLDIIGAYYGEPRGTLSDEDYRKVVLAKAFALRASGTVSDIRTSVDILTENSRIVPAFPAGYRVEVVTPLAVTDVERERLKRFLELTSPAGVQYEAVESLPTSFTFDDDSLGFDLGGFTRIL